MYFLREFFERMLFKKSLACLSFLTIENFFLATAFCLDKEGDDKGGCAKNITGLADEAGPNNIGERVYLREDESAGEGLCVGMGDVDRLFV